MDSWFIALHIRWQFWRYVHSSINDEAANATLCHKPCKLTMFDKHSAFEKWWHAYGHIHQLYLYEHKIVSLLFIRCGIMEWAKLLQSTNQKVAMQHSRSASAKSAMSLTHTQLQCALPFGTWNTASSSNSTACSCISSIYKTIFSCICGPDSSVGVGTDYGLDGPGSNPCGDKIFHPSRLALGST